MNKRWIRLLLAALLMAISIAALAWGLLPGARVTRQQRLQPTEMQLPAPSGMAPASEPLAAEAAGFGVNGITWNDELL